MKQPIAFSDGKMVSADQLVVQPQDLGFMWGVTVAEQLRTFHGKLFQLDSHIERLRGSLQIIGVSGVNPDDLVDSVREVVTHNYLLLNPGEDLGVTIFVTPGLSSTYAPNVERTPHVGVHTYPLPFSLWADKYETGQHCEVVNVPQVSEACWPRHLKSRSRMHYYLADREARAIAPMARAILLDEMGNVNEASTANVVVYFEDEGLVSPPRESILPGISLEFVAKLAKKLDCSFSCRPIAAGEFDRADEILLTSTPFCLLPVSRIGERTLTQRDCFRWLMKAWSNEVGFDIIQQARQTRSSSE